MEAFAVRRQGIEEGAVKDHVEFEIWQRRDGGREQGGGFRRPGPVQRLALIHISEPTRPY